MLVFSTRLPLKDDISKEQCLSTFIEWITNSPHYQITSLDYDVASSLDYDLNVGSVSISIRHLQNEQLELAACRLENREQNITWYNDCIFFNEGDERFLLIQLNRNCSSFSKQPSHIRKPYIVRMFVEQGFCKDDCGIPITDTPLNADTTYYSTCVDIMNGVHSSCMPSVYISCDYWGNTSVNAKYLAAQLGGMAHVFVQKDHETALRLKTDTDGNNAHTGYVGVYYPGKKYCYKYSIEYYSNNQEMAWDIINDLRAVLTNRLDASSHNWNKIIALQSRKKMLEWQDISASDQQQLKEYIATFDAEQDDLKEQIDELNGQILSLRSQVDTYRSALTQNDPSSCFYKKGTEASLYASEKNDLLFNILSQAKPKYEVGSRPYVLIESLLQANPRIGECEKVLSGVRSILSNGGKLTSSQKAELRNLGFSLEEDGKHYKLIFHDPRYSFTLSKTPSDYREGKNMISDICKILDIEKKL